MFTEDVLSPITKGRRKGQKLRHFPLDVPRALFMLKYAQTVSLDSKTPVFGQYKLNGRRDPHQLIEITVFFSHFLDFIP